MLFISTSWVKYQDELIYTRYNTRVKRGEQNYTQYRTTFNPSKVCKSELGAFHRQQ